MKEISYIHSEAYAAGELKHGTISLIEDGILVIGVLTQQELYEKTVSNMVGVQEPGSLSDGTDLAMDNYNIEDTADFTVYVPKTDPYFTHLSGGGAAAADGILRISVAKGLDVDKPQKPRQERDRGVKDNRRIRRRN